MNQTLARVLAARLPCRLCCAAAGVLALTFAHAADPAQQAPLESPPLTVPATEQAAARGTIAPAGQQAAVIQDTAASPAAVDSNGAQAPAAPVSPVASPSATAGSPAIPARQEPAPGSSSNALNSASAMFRTLLGLAAVIGLLVGILWLLRRFGMVKPSGRSVASVIGAVSVGNRERVVVVEVAGQWIVVGVAPGRVTALAQMPAGEADTAMAGATPAAPNFSDWLKQTMQHRQGKTPNAG